MVNTSIQIIRIARPVHWIKNLSIFAALFFTSKLFIPSQINTVFWAFISFNMLTSACYIFNDIIDANKDRNHPVKKFRPIASGKLPVMLALVEMTVFIILAFVFSIDLNKLFHLALIAYLILQIFYSLVLKNIIALDILTIAFGFVIRIYAGAFVINAHLSVWFLLCVISTALFLAAGKRRSEFNIVGSTNAPTRISLSKYSRELLDSYVTMFGNASWLSWSLFSFFESPKASQNVWLFFAEISRAITIDKTLMLTIPIAIYAIMRYESIIFEGKSEAPEKILLTDKGLITSITLWLLIVYWVFYASVK